MLRQRGAYTLRLQYAHFQRAVILRPSREKYFAVPQLAPEAFQVKLADPIVPVQKLGQYVVGLDQYVARLASFFGNDPIRETGANDEVGKVFDDAHAEIVRVREIPRGRSNLIQFGFRLEYRPVLP